MQSEKKGKWECLRKGGQRAAREASRVDLREQGWRVGPREAATPNHNQAHFSRFKPFLRQRIGSRMRHHPFVSLFTVPMPPKFHFLFLSFSHFSLSLFFFYFNVFFFKFHWTCGWAWAWDETAFLFRIFIQYAFSFSFPFFFNISVLKNY